MDSLKLRDLLLPGQPLESAEVVTGREWLDNPVSWVVSLRPYPPAFPRLRGGELALVAVEHLARLEPPTSLGDVVQQLASLKAAAVAVRGEIDSSGRIAAQETRLPLLQLEDNAPLHDIEQEIIRLCALHQARREMTPANTQDTWLRELLAGRLATVAEAQEVARRQGVRLAGRYAVAYVGGQESEIRSQKVGIEELRRVLEKEEEGVLVQEWEGGLALLLGPGLAERAVGVVERIGLACGVGREKGLLQAPESLAEAKLAAMASSLLYEGRPVWYERMGADRLLMVLYRDQPGELRAFVEETIGPLLQYDAGVPTPILPSLQAFVQHGGRLRETAASLFVHRNTLAYRLERVEEVLKVDLRDSNARLAVELGLRALTLVQKTPGE